MHAITEPVPDTALSSTWNYSSASPTSSTSSSTSSTVDNDAATLLRKLCMYDQDSTGQVQLAENAAECRHTVVSDAVSVTVQIWPRRHFVKVHVWLPKETVGRVRAVLIWYYPIDDKRR